MKRSVVTLPDYAIGADVYEKAGSFIKKYGKTAVIIGGKTAMSVAAKDITKSGTRKEELLVGKDM